MSDLRLALRSRNGSANPGHRRRDRFRRLAVGLDLPRLRRVEGRFCCGGGQCMSARQAVVTVVQHLASRRPTLGICLGAQLIARALGANVYPGGRKEIGWGELQLPQAGLQSPLKHLSGVPVLHWHGDTFDLPADAELLASSPVYPHQAFRVGCNVLALQFHPEALTRQFECWLIGHTGELAGAGLDVPTLRSQSRTHGPLLERAGQAMLHAWVADLVWA